MSTSNMLDQPVKGALDEANIAYYSGLKDPHPDVYGLALGLVAASENEFAGESQAAAESFLGDLDPSSLELSSAGPIYTAEMLIRADRIHSVLSAKTRSMVETALVRAIGETEDDSPADLIDLSIAASALSLAEMQEELTLVRQRFSSTEICENADPTSALLGAWGAFKAGLTSVPSCTEGQLKDMYSESLISLNSNLGNKSEVLSAPDCELARSLVRYANVAGDGNGPSLERPAKRMAELLTKNRTDSPLTCISVIQEMNSALNIDPYVTTSEQNELISWTLQGGLPAQTENLGVVGIENLSRIFAASGRSRPVNSTEESWKKSAVGRLAAMPGDSSETLEGRFQSAEKVLKEATQTQQAERQLAVGFLRASVPASCDFTSKKGLNSIIRRYIGQAQIDRITQALAISYLASCGKPVPENESSYLAAIAKNMSTNLSILTMSELWEVQATLCALEPESLIHSEELWQTVAPLISEAGGMRSATNEVSVKATAELIEAVNATKISCEATGSIKHLPLGDTLH
ncbi:hypothetical protein [Glutamicibacter halophytocola]|uniref:Uncharacterized protein n=1 Tax=Glutamicibacter halophytocola TaxID=1933880 RepID=A0AA94XRX0_9MICC|nr:hypothetical protein [Glutamicibacter halophytocola]UUX59301.1 hypothetical protein NUH22_01275 [Glutamicibacter halophytocola]